MSGFPKQDESAFSGRFAEFCGIIRPLMRVNRAILAAVLLSGASVVWGQAEPGNAASHHAAVRETKAMAKPSAEPRTPPRPPSYGQAGVEFTGRALIQLPLLDKRLLLEEDARQAAAFHRKRRIGVHRRLLIEGWGSGEKIRLPDGRRIFFFQVTTPEAVALELHFTRFSLPVGSRLVIYSPGNTEESYQFQDRGPNRGGEFWSPVIPGNAFNVELELQGDTDPDSLPFAVDRVGQIYVDPFLLPFEGAVAGVCNLDVSCYPSFENVSNAVALITITGINVISACSGTLLNNATADSSPFFLTANHCFEEGIGSMDFFWKYRSNVCGGTPTTLSAVPHTASGRFLVGSPWDTGTDFALVEVLGVLPEGAVFAGWSLDDVPLGTAVSGVHHPQASYQRISFGAIAPGEPNYHGVVFSQGTMEPGSSGSALLNPAQQVVGQLLGGTSSCSNLSGPDVYGKFAKSYDLMLDPNGKNYLQVGLGDDQYEPNDTREQALPLPGDGQGRSLIVRTAHPDWFRVTLGPYERLYVTVFAGKLETGELGVEVFQGNEKSPLPIVGPFSGSLPTPRVNFEYLNTGTDRDLLFHLFVKKGQRNAYTLFLTSSPPIPPSGAADVQRPVSRYSANIQFGVLTGTSLLDTTGWVEWGPTNDPASFAKLPPIVASGEPYFKSSLVTLEGLAPDTQYFYRAVAQNAFKTVASTVKTFRTAATTMVLTPNPVDLGTMTIYQPASGSVMITNTGDLPLVLTPSFPWGGATLDPSECLQPVPAGGACSLHFSIFGSSPGPFGALINLGNNSETGDTTVSVTGNVIGPLLGQIGSPGSNFSQLVFTASEWREWKLQNFGNMNAVVSKVEAPSGFEATHTCGVGVPPGGTCSIFVRFAPRAAFTISAPVKVTYNNNNPDFPYSIFVQGTSLDLQLAIARPKRPARSGTGANGQTFEISLFSPQALADAVTLRCEGPSGVKCVVSPDVMHLGGGLADAVVKISTVSRSQRLRTRTGSVRVTATYQGMSRTLDLPLQVQP